MNDKRKKKSHFIVRILALLGLLLLGGTYAWLTYRDEKVNVMTAGDLSDGRVFLEEEYENVTRWQQGEEHPKKVRVTNGGIAPVFTRVSFEEYFFYFPNMGEMTTFPLTGDNWNLPPEYTFVPGDYPSYTEEEGWLEFVDLDQIIAAIPNLPSAIRGQQTLGIKVKIIETEPPAVQIKGTMNKVTTYKYGTSSYRISMDLAVTDASADDPRLWKYTMSNPVIYARPSQPIRVMVGKDWAGEKAVLGKKDVRASNGQLYDYSLPGVGDVLTTLAQGPQIPHEDPNDSSRWIAKVQADAELNSSLYLFMEAQNMADAPTTGNSKKWFYNQEDGYFYYLAVLEKGETTPDFLSGVGLQVTAGVAYSNMDFHLIPTMEALQATKDALLDESGWNLSEDQAITGYLLSLLSE